MARMTGADADALDDAARRVEEAAHQLEQSGRLLRAKLYQAPWTGADADEFRREWDERHGKAVNHSAHFLREASRELRRNASQQRQASGSDGGGRGTGGSGGNDHGPGHRPVGPGGPGGPGGNDHGPGRWPVGPDWRPKPLPWPGGPGGPGGPGTGPGGWSVWPILLPQPFPWPGDGGSIGPIGGWPGGSGGWPGGGIGWPGGEWPGGVTPIIGVPLPILLDLLGIGGGDVPAGDPSMGPGLTEGTASVPQGDLAMVGGPDAPVDAPAAPVADAPSAGPSSGGGSTGGGSVGGGSGGGSTGGGSGGGSVGGGGGAPPAAPSGSDAGGAPPGPGSTAGEWIARNGGAFGDAAVGGVSESLGAAQLASSWRDQGSGLSPATMGAIAVGAGMLASGLGSLAFSRGYKGSEWLSRTPKSDVDTGTRPVGERLGDLPVATPTWSHPIEGAAPSPAPPRAASEASIHTTPRPARPWVAGWNGVEGAYR